MVVYSAEGQPDSIVHDIENMVRSYIEKVLCILVFILLIWSNLVIEQNLVIKLYGFYGYHALIVLN